MRRPDDASPSGSTGLRPWALEFSPPTVLVAALMLLAGAADAAAAEAVVELEARASEATVDGGGIVVQPMGGFGPGWGGDAQIFWRPDGPGNTLLVPFGAAAGTYDLLLFYTVAPDYGDFSVRVNGGAATRVMAYGQTVALRSVPIGRHEIGPANQLEFIVEGRDAKSSGLVLGLDRIELLAIAPGVEPAPQVAISALQRLPRLKVARPREEFAVVDGGRVRLGRVEDGNALTVGPQRDLPEGMHWVGNFDGVAGDELLTWDPVSGNHFITRFTPGGGATSQKVYGSYVFDEEVYRTVGRFAEPGASCLFGWREGASFGVRRLIDGVCFSASFYGAVEGVAVAADVTGDGRDEAVFVTPDGTLDVMVLGGHRPGEPGAKTDLLERSAERAAERWSPGLEIAVADVDGDGAQEILAMVRSKAEVWRLDFDAAGRVTGRVLVASGWPADRALGWPLDTTGTGRDQLLVRSSSTRELWIASVAEGSLQLEYLDDVRPAFAYPGRFLGGSRHALLTHIVQPGKGGRLGLLARDAGGWVPFVTDDPAHAVAEFATVLVGDFLPD